MKVINLKNYGIVVISTVLTAIAIQALAKHNPKSLKLQDEDKNEVFGISYGPASVTRHGVSFDKTDSEGCALVTIQVTMDANEIAENYAKILNNLKKVEVQATAAYSTLSAELAEITASIVDGSN